MYLLIFRRCFNEFFFYFYAYLFFFLIPVIQSSVVTIYAKCHVTRIGLRGIISERTVKKFFCPERHRVVGGVVVLCHLGRSITNHCPPFPHCKLHTTKLTVPCELPHIITSPYFFTYSTKLSYISDIFLHLDLNLVARK